MTEALPPGPRRERARDPVRSALMACAAYFCLVGLTLLALDLVNWWLAGTYESPCLMGMVAMRWMAVPGIALCGGAAMVAGSCRPVRPWGFFAAMVMLLIFVWCWDLSQFLSSET